MENIKFFILFIILFGVLFLVRCSSDEKSVNDSIEDRLNYLETYQTVGIPIVSTDKKSNAVK